MPHANTFGWVGCCLRDRSSTGRGVVASRVFSSSAGCGAGVVVGSALGLGEGLQVSGEVEDLSVEGTEA